MTLRPALWILLWLASATVVFAQDVVPSDDPAAGQQTVDQQAPTEPQTPLENAMEGTGVPIAPPPGSQVAQVATGTADSSAAPLVAPTNPPDYAAWARVAAQTETALEGGNPSSLRLQNMRAALVLWRDVFLIEQSANAGRIGTVQTQIDSMGLVPAEGAQPETEQVAARRAELGDQMARLREPVLLAQEAHAHANGLIGEIDSIIRIQQTRALMIRGPSPLNPTVWPDVMDAISARIVGLWKELHTSIRSEVRQAKLAESWPYVGLLLLICLVILIRGRRWLKVVEAALNDTYPRGGGVWRFLMSIAEIIVPMAGLIALTSALNRSGMFGFRATQLIDAIPATGLYVLIARGLSGHFFNPAQINPPPFDFTDAEKIGPRRLTFQLGWVLAALFLALTFINTGNVSPEVRAVVILPFELYLAFILYRFGRCLRKLGLPNTEPGQANEVLFFGRRMMILAGRLIMIASVVAPILTILGFSAAATAILYPTIQTLALLGVLVLLQWVTFDLHAFVTGSDNRSNDALLPVIVGFVLVIAALPFLALIWGARVEDLNEIWTRFRDGYAIGETRISPIDVLTFLLIFAVGYMLTRLVQGTLRTSILPKTKMDIGAQNAIVSGLGYVGIFIAAVLAITSTGLDLSNLAIVAGALSVGIGFGLQTIVSNFVSGIILLIERPISEGDWIEVGGRMGYVRDISVRSTRIETFDRTDVIVPNADLVSGQVVNWTRGNSVGRVIVPVSVVFGTDTAKVQAVLQEVAESHPMVLLVPPPSVVLVNFGPDSLNYEIRAIVRDVNFGLTVRSEMNQSIANRFFDEGIEMAGMARANMSPGRTAFSDPVPPVATEMDMASAYTHKAALRRADGDDG